jgi:hypothetical protein
MSYNANDVIGHSSLKCNRSSYSLHLDTITGEELLHEEWSSYDNLSGILVVTVTEFVGTHLYILQKPSSKMIIFIFKKWVLAALLNFND